MAVLQLCKPDKHVSARMSTRTEPLSGIKQAMAMSSGKQKWSATYLMALVHSSFMLRSHSIRAMSSWSLPPGWGEATACARGTFTDVCFGLVMRSMISIVWRYHEGIDSGGQTGQASSFQA